MPFASLGLPEPITRSVRAAGYAEPTPIQRKAIPLILPGHDLVAAAQTGSGKTAAFLLPILVRLLEGPRALRALVLVPTRELAAQVEACGREYARFTGVRVGVVYGGVPIGPQERLLRRDGVELLVATPGRLLDLHGRHSVSLEEVEVLVLDEADRMVDMGFAPDLKRILALLPAQRQTLMFSATMPPELNRVAQEALHNPKRLDLAPPSRPASGIEQAFYPVPRHLKPALLEEILSRSPEHSVLVFTRTKHGADRLTRQLRNRGREIAVIHGDRSQGQRERALSDFKRGRVGVLVATDIASRGIDVDDITHVINYDVPRTPEDYVHRIGRTGRMDATGDAFTLASPEEHEEVAAIERFLGLRVPRVTLEGFDYKRRSVAEPSDRGAHPRGSRVHGAGPATRPRRGSGPQLRVPPARVVSGASEAADHGRRKKSAAGDRRSRRKM
jgi:ATP-dependent RNA helicase RhlE